MPFFLKKVHKNIDLCPTFADMTLGAGFKSQTRRNCTALVQNFMQIKFAPSLGESTALSPANHIIVWNADMNDIKIKDIMSTDFANIDVSSPVVEASMELIRKEALGGPVVDAERKLLGWISEQECLQVTTQVAYHNQRVATVKDIMRDDVLTVSCEQTVLSLAEKMMGNLPKNYPVVDESGKLVGVVTRRRVLKSILSTINTATA